MAIMGERRNETHAQIIGTLERLFPLFFLVKIDHITYDESCIIKLYF